MNELLSHAKKNVFCIGNSKFIVSLQREILARFYRKTVPEKK